MSQETFFNYRNSLYLWLSLGLVALSTGLYMIDAPLGGPSGGSVLGYTLGGIATAGILYLMWYGIRKRSYHAAHTTLKATLAAHVWLGISLLVIVPLHSGFQFGLNVHTAAYVVLVLVVLSGIWGAINFATLGPKIRAHRGGGSHKQLLEQIEQLSKEADALLHGDVSDNLVSFSQKFLKPFRPSLSHIVRGRDIGGGKYRERLNRELAAQLLVSMPEGDKKKALSLIELLTKREALIDQLSQDIATLFWLRVWLCVHLPFSIALLVLVGIHIFTVFYFW